MWRGSCARCPSPAGEGPGPSRGCRSWTRRCPGVPRPVLGLGTPPAIVGPLGWLSLGKLARDPHPVPLRTSLVPLGGRESHLSTSRSPPWRPAPSGCAQRGGATSVRDPLSRRGPGGLGGCRSLSPAFLCQPCSGGAGPRLACPGVGGGLWALETVPSFPVSRLCDLGRLNMPLCAPVSPSAEW